MARVELEKVTKVYPGNVKAVNAIDLSIRDQEFVVLVGPSGCGKSTTLRMVAGLEEITDGVIRIGDRIVNDVPPKNRDIAMVFQNYALYPHMSVYGNMAYGLKIRGMSKADIDTRVKRAAEILELGPLLEIVDLAAHLHPQLRVEVRQGLVHEERLRLAHERAPHRDTLPLPARERLGLSLQ